MKLIKFLGFLVVLILVLAVVAQFVMSNKLTDILRDKVLPLAEEELGVEVDVGSASVNLFGGSVGAQDIRIGNPAGFPEEDLFSMEEFGIRINLPALLKKRVHVAGGRISDARLSIYRNSEGLVNVEALSGKKPQTRKPRAPGGGGSPSKPTTKETTTETLSKMEAPEALISEFDANALIEYTDAKIRREPFRIALVADMEARELSTIKDPDQDWGAIRLNAHLENSPREFVVTLNGKVAPITDPEKPSFDINLDISSVNLQDMKPLAELIGIESQSVSAKAPIKCNDGALRGTIKVVFEKPRLVGKLAKEARGYKLPETLTVSLPVRGTVKEPVLRWEEAILETILRNFAATAESTIKSEATKKLGEVIKDAAEDLGGDEELQKQLEKGLESIGEIFKLGK